MKTKRNVILSVVAAAILLLAPGAQAEDMAKIKLGMGTWVGYCPVYIARANGYYKDHNLDLELLTFSGNDAQNAFAANRLDMTSTAGSSMLTMAANDVAFKNFMIADFSSGADGILARDSIKTVADVKGQRVAVEQAAVSHFFLLQILDKAGLEESDITMINLAPDVAAASFLSGEVDVAVTYAPYLGQIDAQVDNGRVIIDSSEDPTAIVDFYQVRDEVLEEKPEAVISFVNGTLDGLEFLQENKAEALKICGEAMDVSPEQVDADLAGVDLPDLQENIDALSNPDSPLYVGPALESLSVFLNEKVQLDVVEDVSKFLDASSLKAAKADR